MPRVASKPDQISEIFIDESSQTKHRYLGLGGLIVDLSSRAPLEAALAKARLPELPKSEIKWTKVSASKLPAYKRVVDVFFDGVVDVAPLHFHSLVIDTSRINDAAHNDASRDIGFNKEVYQLCMKFGRLYNGRIFHVYPDQRSTSQLTEDLRLMLNRGIAKKGDKRDWPYRRIHFRNSSTTPLLQLTDVLLGAFLFRRNGHRYAQDASPAKSELSDHVLYRARINNMELDTPMSGKFTVWNRKYR